MDTQLEEQPSLPELEAELLGDCKWTLKQNQSIIAALKKENRELKAALAVLPPPFGNGQAVVQAEIRGLDSQVNDLRKYHDKLVQDRLRSTAKLAQLKDSIKDLETDSQLVFKDSPGTLLAKSLDNKLTAALLKHDAAQSSCQELEQCADALRQHRLSHNSQLTSMEQTVRDQQLQLADVLAAHAAVQQTQELAKAELAQAEQQLLTQRRSRTMQLEQHAAQVQQQQERYTAQQTGAAQRLQRWKTLMQPRPAFAALLAADASPAADTAADAPPRSPQAALTAQEQTGSSAGAGGFSQDGAVMAVSADNVAGNSEALFTADIKVSAATQSELADAAPAASTGEMDLSSTAQRQHTGNTDVEAAGAADNAGPSGSQKDAVASNSNDAASSDLLAGSRSAAEASSGRSDRAQGPAQGLDQAVTCDEASMPDAASACGPASMSDQASASGQASVPDQAAVLTLASTPDQDAATVLASKAEAASASALDLVVEDAGAGAEEDPSDDAVTGADADLSCIQAFAALQYATGIEDMTQLVDRFLAQDSTKEALEQLRQEALCYLHHLHIHSSHLQARAAELQHRRHLVHQEAEAAIKQAAAQQELNAGQYDHAGRALVHVKLETQRTGAESEAAAILSSPMTIFCCCEATIQTLVEKLQPLFPEMAHQRASNDTLCDAIQSCETCLRHAHLSLQAYQKQTGFAARVTGDAEAKGNIEFHLDKSGLEPVMMPSHGENVATQPVTGDKEAQPARATISADVTDSQAVSQGSWSIPSQPAVA